MGAHRGEAVDVLPREDVVDPHGHASVDEERHGAVGDGGSVEAAHRGVAVAHAVVGDVHLREGGEGARPLGGEAEAAGGDHGHEAEVAREASELGEVVARGALGPPKATVKTPRAERSRRARSMEERSTCAPSGEADR
ncbi:MAG: hypothetical protein R3A52_29080 [Polyangiales bacterium]